MDKPNAIAGFFVVVQLDGDVSVYEHEPDNFEPLRASNEADYITAGYAITTAAQRQQIMSYIDYRLQDEKEKSISQVVRDALAGRAVATDEQAAYETVPWGNGS